jgi:hypothetical protein
LKSAGKDVTKKRRNSLTGEKKYTAVLKMMRVK